MFYYADNKWGASNKEHKTYVSKNQFHLFPHL